MSLAEFRQVVGSCTEDEIDRLRTRYKRYYREHREVFTDLLLGQYEDDESFRRALLEARKKARMTDPTRTSAGGFGRTNDRKFIKLAVRIMFLRLTEDEGVSPAAAKKRDLVRVFEPWGLTYDAIRKHTPFQDDY